MEIELDEEDQIRFEEISRLMESDYVTTLSKILDVMFFMRQHSLEGFNPAFMNDKDEYFLWDVKGLTTNEDPSYDTD